MAILEGYDTYSFSNRYPERLDTRSFQTSIQNIDTSTKVDAG